MKDAVLEAPVKPAVVSAEERFLFDLNGFLLLTLQPGAPGTAPIADAARRWNGPVTGIALTFVWILGLTLIWFDATQQRWGWSFLLTPWMLTKLTGVLFLTWWHHYLGVARTKIARGERPHSERFWRATNELPFLAAIVMIIAIVTKYSF